MLEGIEGELTWDPASNARVEIRICPEQLWIKCFTNYSLRTSSWILNTITLCLKTFKIFYLMAAMIAGDCFDLNISVVMRERFKATKVLREY